MNEESQTVEESVIKEVDKTTSELGTFQVNTPEMEVMVTSPIDFRESTIFHTEKGDIHVIHEITLGDIVLSTLMMAMLIFLILDRVIRR